MTFVLLFLGLALSLSRPEPSTWPALRENLWRGILGAWLQFAAVACAMATSAGRPSWAYLLLLACGGWFFHQGMGRTSAAWRLHRYLRGLRRKSAAGEWLTAPEFHAFAMTRKERA